MRVKLQNVSFRYSGNARDAVSDLTLEVDDGQSIAILGQSGSGKSTLVHLIAGMIAPRKGEIRLNRQLVTEISPEERRIALVLQRAPTLRGISVKDLVSRPSKMRSGSYRGLDVNDALDALGLGQLRDKSIGALSGGQQQRAHLARTLVWDPDVILLDEPFTSLDYQFRHSIYPLLRIHHEQIGKSLILITHDPQEALLLCESLVVVKDGRKLLSGESNAIAKRPPFLEIGQILYGYATNRISVSLAQDSNASWILTTPLGSFRGRLDLARPMTPDDRNAWTLLRWNDIVAIAGIPADADAKEYVRICVSQVPRGSSTPFIYWLNGVAIYGSAPTENPHIGEVFVTTTCSEILVYSKSDEGLLGVFHRLVD